VFLAATKLARFRQLNSARIFKKCSPPPSTKAPEHECLAEEYALCGNGGGCDRGVCFYHSLRIRRSHAVDDILDSGQKDVSQYHSKHTSGSRRPTDFLNEKDSFNRLFGKEYGSTTVMFPRRISTTPMKSSKRKSTGQSSKPPTFESLLTLEPGVRLIWAALTFPNCDPEEPSRSRLGWYDDIVSI